MSGERKSGPRGLLERFRNRDGGAASVEFAIYLPLFLAVFMAAFESGLLTLRNVMLERSVDIVVRDLRLGTMEDPTHDTVREAICARSGGMIPSCTDVLLLELIPVDGDTYDLPAQNNACVNRDEEIQPVTDFNPGGQNDLMIVRACAIFDAIFPTTGLGLQLVVDESGGYQVTAASAFVNEPS